ncbi:MAG: hypothetical protein ABF805_04265 [Bifidobacterium sp.]
MSSDAITTDTAGYQRNHNLSDRVTKCGHGINTTMYARLILTHPRG